MTSSVPVTSAPRPAAAPAPAAVAQDRGALPRVTVVLIGAAAELAGTAVPDTDPLAAGVVERVAIVRGTEAELVALRGAHPDLHVLQASTPAEVAARRREVVAASAADAFWFVAADRSSRAATDVAAPTCSVIVPAANAASMLSRTLPVLRTATHALGGELVIVDDASGDDTSVVAAEVADKLVRIRGRERGPAYARNRGVDVTDGEVLVFVDADVLVTGPVLTELVSTLGRERGISAVFGSYADGPAGAGFITRYRNILSHELHETLAGDVDIFWAACGAVRRDAFAAVGGFDEWRFTDAEVESVELGHRLRAHGHRIVLRAELQVTHLRPSSLGSLVLDDLRQFVVPLYRVARDGGLPHIEFPVRIEKRASILVLLGMLCALVALAGVPIVPVWWGAAALFPLSAAVMRWPLYAYFARHGGLGFALAVVPLHQAHATATAVAALLGRVLGSFFGEPRPDALTEAFAEVGVRKWPPLPRRPAPKP